MTKWDRYFMNVALETAKLSSATRLKVGAVAVKDKRIVCCGFNGTAPGRPNECEELVETLSGEYFKTKDETLHAERNLVSFAARHGIPMEGCSMYLTHSPCLVCATMILASGFSSVIYNTQYRNNDGLDFLMESGVTIIRME